MKYATHATQTQSAIQQEVSQYLSNVAYQAMSIDIIVDKMSKTAKTVKVKVTVAMFSRLNVDIHTVDTVVKASHLEGMSPADILFYCTDHVNGVLGLNKLEDGHHISLFIAEKEATAFWVNLKGKTLSSVVEGKLVAYRIENMETYPTGELYGVTYGNQKCVLLFDKA